MSYTRAPTLSTAVPAAQPTERRLRGETECKCLSVLFFVIGSGSFRDSWAFWTTVGGRGRVLGGFSKQTLHTKMGLKTFLGFISFYVADILKTGWQDQSNSLRDDVSVEWKQTPFQGLLLWQLNCTTKDAACVTAHTSF